MDFLEISCAKDLEKKSERILYRFFEILPGFLSLLTLFLTILLSIFSPLTVSIFIIGFSLYWLLRVIYFSILQISTYFQLKKNLKINHLEKLKKEFPQEWEKIYHIVILPTYKEGEKILRDSVESILNSNYPKNRIIVVISVEERAGPKYLKEAEKVKKDFENYFFKFFVFLHPKNLPGEAIGKGANTHFAFEKIKEVVKELSIPEENILVSNFDCDTKVFPDYFSVLTSKYLKAKDKRCAFQPIPIYSNNVWDAPFFSRIVSTSSTYWQMIQHQRPEKSATFSSHALPYLVLKEVPYPKNLIPDDSRIYWKAFLYYNGNFKVRPLFYPVQMDAVLGENLFKTILYQYKQQRRWAWGVTDFPFLVFGFFKNKNIPFSKKFFSALNLLEGFWSWAVAALLLFLLGWLPPLLGQVSFQKTFLASYLPYLIQKLMTLASLGMIVCAILNYKILAPMPQKINFFKKISILIQWLFIPVTMIVFGCLPALDAQIRLLFGKYMEFWPTKKVRKEKT